MPVLPIRCAKNPAALRKFLDYRAGLASKMQADWLDVIDRTRASKPYLDIVLTHIDDRFEPGIRDALGADVARSLPAIQARKSTLLVEDPATLWSLGPERYAKLAEKYRELTPDTRQIAVDINVVERYQDVYPTKKQTGVELLELVHQAASSFARVALYFENSLERQDLRLIPAAATTAKLAKDRNGVFRVEANEDTRVAWTGPVALDGKPWPIANDKSVLAPAGKHTLETSAARPAVSISDFNGEIRTAVAATDRADLSYTSRSRAVAVLGLSRIVDRTGRRAVQQERAGRQLRFFYRPASTWSRSIVDSCEIAAPFLKLVQHLAFFTRSILWIASVTISTRAPVSSRPNWHGARRLPLPRRRQHSDLRQDARGADAESDW